MILVFLSASECANSRRIAAAERHDAHQQQIIDGQHTALKNGQAFGQGIFESLFAACLYHRQG
jgi:hypothetical protein